MSRTNGWAATWVPFIVIPPSVNGGGVSTSGPIERLALKVHESDFRFNQIICIARGGLRVGDVMSRIFKLPLAVKLDSRWLLPAAYGVGTAVPVVVFALLVAGGARSVARGFGAVTRLEPHARKVTGVLFVGVGIYYALRFIFGLLP
mgnify:CR=1 FL=1